MSKFPNALAEALYASDADSEHGSSSEGVGWAGVYDLTRPEDADLRKQADAPFVVLVERTDGFVDMFRAGMRCEAELLASEYDD